MDKEKFVDICQRERDWQDAWTNLEHAIGGDLSNSEIYDKHGQTFDDLIMRYLKPSFQDEFMEFMWGGPYYSSNYDEEYPMVITVGETQETLTNFEDFYDYVTKYDGWQSNE